MVWAGKLAKSGHGDGGETVEPGVWLCRQLCSPWLSSHEQHGGPVDEPADKILVRRAGPSWEQNFERMPSSRLGAVA